MKDTHQYLVVVRHGQTLPNVLLKQAEDALYYAVSGSDRTVSLTDFGVKQVTGRGQLLAQLFPPTRPIAKIVHGSFHRVVQSADLLCQHLPYAPQRCNDDRLNKRDYGHLWNVTYRGLRELFPQEYERFRREGKFYYRPPAGENYPDLFERVDDVFYEEIDCAEGNLVVVTHLIVVLAIRRIIEGLSEDEVVQLYEDVHHDNAHVRIYVREDSTRPWRLHSCYDVSEDAEEQSGWESAAHAEAQAALGESAADAETQAALGETAADAPESLQCETAADADVLPAPSKTAAGAPDRVKTKK